MINILDVAYYIISSLLDKDQNINPLKLQKLLYYVQAWYLANNNRPLFEARFEAWAHGPVNRQTYDLFKDRYGMYDPLSSDIIPESFTIETIDYGNRLFIESVLEAYSPYSAVQLESLTHQERPWIAARKGLQDYERSENLIDEQEMAKYYSSQL